MRPSLLRNGPGDRDKAVEFLVTALQLSDEIGMPVLTERIQAGTGTAGRQAQTQDARWKEDTESPKGSVLTPREREVAALVAEGMTNRQIGESLFVAERTAETHVENILMKLGFTSRSQVARWVLDTGLHVEDT